MTSYLPSLNVQPANQVLHIEFADKKKTKCSINIETFVLSNKEINKYTVYINKNTSETSTPNPWFHVFLVKPLGFIRIVLTFEAIYGFGGGCFCESRRCMACGLGGGVTFVTLVTLRKGGQGVISCLAYCGMLSQFFILWVVWKTKSVGKSCIDMHWSLCPRFSISWIFSYSNGWGFLFAESWQKPVNVKDFPGDQGDLTIAWVDYPYLQPLNVHRFLESTGSMTSPGGFWVLKISGVYFCLPRSFSKCSSTKNHHICTRLQVFAKNSFVSTTK